MHPATVYIVIAVLTFGIFSGVNLHEYVDYGDQRMIVDNVLVQRGFNDGNVTRAFEIEPGLPWQPLAWISLQAGDEWHGLSDAGPVLLGNLALHIGTTLLLLFALARLTGAFWPSAFVAAMYAVHPIAAESVAWAFGRADALAHFFFAALLGTWAIYVDRPGRVRFAAVVLCAMGGVLAGGRFAAVPFLLLVLDVWPLGRLGFAGTRIGRFADRPEASPALLLAEKAPLLVIGIVGLAARLVADAEVTSPWGADPSLFERFGIVVANVFTGIGRIVWPSDLAFTAPTTIQMGLGPVPLWQVTLGLVAIALITVGLVRAGAAARPALAGWFWYLVMIVPVAGLVPIGLRMMHDRQLQLAMIGLLVALAFTAARLLEAVPRRPVVAGGLAALLLVPAAAAARAQASTWRDSNALFDHALAVHDRDVMALFYKAMRLLEGGFDTAAVAQLERAVDIYPNHVHANVALGQLRMQAGEPERALVPLRRALVGMPASAFVQATIATALLEMGRIDEARVEIDRALASDPRSAFAHLQRARMAVRLGQPDAAITDYERTLELDPSNGKARAELRSLERAMVGEPPS